MNRPLSGFLSSRASGAVAVAAVCAAGLLLTSSGLPMGWDEGDAIFRAKEIPATWEYTTQWEGHPAFSGIVIAAGHRLAGPWLPPLVAWRFGPILLFAVAVGAMYYRMAADYSPAAGLGAAAALLLMPRVFAHAHFAGFDGPLVSCWILRGRRLRRLAGIGVWRCSGERSSARP